MNDLNLVLKALGTQVKPIIDVVEAMPETDRASAYARAITTLVSMTGDSKSKTIKLGVAVAFSRAGAHKPSVDKAARTIGAIP